MKTSYPLLNSEHSSYLALTNFGPVLQGLQNTLLLCGAVIGSLALYEFLQRIYLTVLIRKLRFKADVLSRQNIDLRQKIRDLDAQASVIRDACNKVHYAHKGNEGENVSDQATASGKRR